MVKFLVIRFSSIGDIVLTTPVIRVIKTQIENSKIHYLTKKENSIILENNPYIDNIHLLDQNNYKKLIEDLYHEHFDYIIDLHNNIRTNKIKRKLKVLSFTLNKLNIEKWLIVNLKYNKLPNIHIVDRYLETLKPFSVKNDNKGLDYFLTEKDSIDIKSILKNKEKNVISFIIGAKHFTKQIQTKNIIEISNSINFNIVLLGGKEDIEKSIEIENNTKNSINLVGKLTLNESASIISQSDLVITSDTGLMHIASAFKKNIISIWGNTIPEFGMYPYLAGKESYIFENKNLKCRPCSKIGFSKCPKSHLKCMNDINYNEIIKTINFILS